VDQRKEVYAPIDCGIAYRTNVDTSLWDPSSVDICRVIYTVAHKRHQVVHEDAVVCSSIQLLCAVVYNGFLGLSPRDTSRQGLQTHH
jgi:hypothetical protein